LGEKARQGRHGLRKVHRVTKCRRTSQDGATPAASFLGGMKRSLVGWGGPFPIVCGRANYARGDDGGANIKDPLFTKGAEP